MSHAPIERTRLFSSPSDPTRGVREVEGGGDASTSIARPHHRAPPFLPLPRAPSPGFHPVALARELLQPSSPPPHLNARGAWERGGGARG